MWNPFRKKPLLSEEDEFFQIETYRWLLRNFGGDDFYKDTRLILPTEEFFPERPQSPEGLAQYLFERVKKYAGLENWPCTLKAQEAGPNLKVAETLVVQGTKPPPNGTFLINDDNSATITYNPELTADPETLVATFAHELAHFLTCTTAEPPPGGWDNWEFATDIASTFMGFGVFAANNAFRFQQFHNATSYGWRTDGAGYLSQAEHSYAFALFLLLLDIPPETAAQHCSQNTRVYLGKALKELRKSTYIEELRAIEHQPKLNTGKGDE